jgi:hypothetical protein
MLKLKACAALHLEASDTPGDFRDLLQQISGQSVRRISRFAAFALAGAHACAKQAGGLNPDCALYFCSEQSNLKDTANTVHGITIDHRPPTPFDFLNISSNVTGFHVAKQLGLNGPNLTMCRSDSSFEAGLELAMLTASQQPTLIGYVEDCAWPLWQQHERVGWPRELPIAECSHWLYFERNATAPQAVIESCKRYANREQALATLRSEAASSDWFSTGLKLDETEAAWWQEQLKMRRFAVVNTPVFSKGLSALAICRFAERGEPGRMLHLNRTAAGEYYATVMTKM